MTKETIKNFTVASILILIVGAISILIISIVKNVKENGTIYKSTIDTCKSISDSTVQQDSVVKKCDTSCKNMHK